METIFIIGFIASACWGWATIIEKKGKRAQEQLLDRARQHTDNACAYIADVNRSRAFPTIQMQDVNAQKGEFGLLREPSNLIEIKTQRYSLGSGTRVKLGKIPLYLGGSKQFSYESPTVGGTGDLYLTNRRIIFLSSTRSVTIALKDIIGIEADLSSITPHTNKQKKPIAFVVGNPALWSMLIKVATAGNLDTPFLPEGVVMEATPTDTPGEVNFSAKQATGSSPVIKYYGSAAQEPDKT